MRTIIVLLLLSFVVACAAESRHERALRYYSSHSANGYARVDDNGIIYYPNRTAVCNRVTCNDGSVIIGNQKHNADGSIEFLH